MVRGFCPYCGHQNPPDYRFCFQCRRRIPDPTSASEGPRRVGPPAGVDVSPASPVGASGGRGASGIASRNSDAPPVTEEAPSEGGGWGVVVLAIAVVVIILLAGLFALGRFPGSIGNNGHPGAPGPGVVVDLCNASRGIDCTGNRIVLPGTAGGTIQNHTVCDSFPSAGGGEELWLNFTTSAPATGVVLPQANYGGSGGFAADPVGFLANASDRRQTGWASQNVTGSDTALVQVPSDGGTWCVSWYAPVYPGATITWTSDVVYAYHRSG
jgi:hypothetical protein